MQRMSFAFYRRALSLAEDDRGPSYQTNPRNIVSGQALFTSVQNRSRRRCAFAGNAANHSPRSKISGVGYSVVFVRSVDERSRCAAPLVVAVRISVAMVAATSAL